MVKVSHSLDVLTIAIVPSARTKLANVEVFILFSAPSDRNAGLVVTSCEIY